MGAAVDAGPYKTLTVEELLFTGFADPLLELGAGIPRLDGLASKTNFSSTDSLEAFDKISKEGDGSTDDKFDTGYGPTVYHTGRGDLKKLGLVLRARGSTGTFPAK